MKMQENRFGTIEKSAGTRWFYVTPGESQW